MLYALIMANFCVRASSLQLIQSSRRIIPSRSRCSTSYYLDLSALGTNYVKTTTRIFSESSDSSLSSLNEKDTAFLKKAIEHARHGVGHTFPNPAVGCVLVRHDTGEIIGSGFHPRAGYPHAEVFALFEAAGHVPDGVAAAKAVVESKNNREHQQLFDNVLRLSEAYASPGGPEELFGNCFLNIPVTAYVTLEPCCHYGKTPPCAGSLAISGASRVVVGLRDPNPRVDGGGVQVLQNAGIQVDMVGMELEDECFDLCEGFCKRITPKDDISRNDYQGVNGAMRSALRSLANRKQNNASLAQISWGGNSINVDDSENLAEDVQNLELEAEWMEHLDGLLWREEIVLLRLNKAAAKRKAVKLLGDRIAKELQAHIAQSVGHTILLYRPGIPPGLDLKRLVDDYRSS